MDDYVLVNGKKLRKGYTTGSCAAAASKAAVMMLVSGAVPQSVCIRLPSGELLELAVGDAALRDGEAVCSVVKDGGDDPDVTTGLKIFATARLMGESGINIKAGEGIGRVTLPGLKAEVGGPAINPVPMHMIVNAVREAAGEGRGAEIVLSVPGGEEIAKSTYNPRLGIVGGISILGTTGIVVPVSEDAWREALAAELNVLSARGIKNPVYAFGNYGQHFGVDKLGLREDNIIKIGNFVGFMLDRAIECKAHSVLIIGHMGKLVKVSAGIFNTHSRTADARMEILAGYAALEGASCGVVSQIYGCGTTEAAMAIIASEGLNGVFRRVVSNASERCMQYTFNKIRVGTVLFDGCGTLLEMDSNARDMLDKLGRGYE
ncbi:cobalt-precorrin 5B C1-methyltransferase [Anaerobacterium chartisolvens]|uniref:Cobalt-precorrin-5B C(1)-methyltransferase n=1 Tax=Anaerobacterium chartisolvens TaxID=1297424 RepID=A0A369B7S6_9FIRM|nr:cobalt-precorrin-5B (C(1))-methyltransferase CbiD [Anaerobacterium chartisolvens]RCX17579.1 cobalt-precorrin 5B C1-methyltransferase [Anaerobacterium chartisolvens]